MDELLRVERDGASNSSSSSQAKHGSTSNRDKMMGMMVKMALLRSVSVNLAELRRVFKVKNLWFMGEIVTDGVGHWRTYGPRGQVKGGRGAQKKGIKVGMEFWKFNV